MYEQVHVHVRRKSMTELPTSDEELASWCHKAFATKVVPSEPIHVLFGTVLVAIARFARGCLLFW
jgi:hypothetical protein